MFKIEIGDNAMYVLNTLLICSTLTVLAWFITDYNKSVFESGYTQIIQEGKIVWVKDDSVIQK